MKRALIVAVCLVIATAALLEAQSGGINDQEIQRFVLPGTNTTGLRVHATSSVMNLRLVGDVQADGGYKTPYTFAHGGYLVAGITQTASPIAGTISAANTVGVSYQRAPWAGSVMGVSIASSAAITANAAHAEATILNPTSGAVRGSGLRAVIGAGMTGQTQYGSNTAAKDAQMQFSAGEAVGCRITTDSGITPISAELACTIVVEQ